MSTETQTTETGAENTEAAAVSQTADGQVDTTGQQAQEQAGEQGQKQDGQAKPDGAPEQYEDFKFEGDATLPEDMAADIKAIAKELNLPQAQAQKLADLALKKSADSQAKQMEALETARNEWAESARADKEFGGDAFDANLGMAKKALDAFGTPELRGLLNETGMGNHPEVIRFMYRAGKAISGDKIVTGAAGSAAPADPAKRLFPNQA